ncbi:hypothetical protein J6590_006793 [Homalodisca vitripennis]|nr:hypothetical protein J6590_006793 [Homalodisca vitripennis]
MTMSKREGVLAGWTSATPRSTAWTPGRRGVARAVDSTAEGIHTSATATAASFVNKQTGTGTAPHRMYRSCRPGVLSALLRTIYRIS